MTTRPLVLAATLAAASWASGGPAHAQEAVFVVRHAEAVQDGSRDPPLTEAGARRALALADLLAEAGITAIYTSELRRTLDTAAPLAARLALPVTAIPQAPFEESLVARLAREHPEGRVLVVGHSNTVPELLRLYGEAGPPEIERGDHGNLFVIVPSPDGPATVLRLRMEPSG